MGFQHDLIGRGGFLAVGAGSVDVERAIKIIFQSHAHAVGILLILIVGGSPGHAGFFCACGHKFIFDAVHIQAGIVHAGLDVKMDALSGKQGVWPGKAAA